MLVHYEYNSHKPLGKPICRHSQWFKSVTHSGAYFFFWHPASLFQVWVKVWAHAWHLVTFKGCSWQWCFRRQLKVLTAKINSQAFGATLRNNFGWSDGQVKVQGIREGNSKSASVAAVLDLLAFWRRATTPANTDSVQESKGFNALKNFWHCLVPPTMVFPCKNRISICFARTCYTPNQHSSIGSSFQNICWSLSGS